MKAIKFLFFVILFNSSVLADKPYLDTLARSKISDHLSGLKNGGMFSLTFKSKLDSTPQPLLLKIPKNYDKNKKWPLLVVLHGMGDGPIIVDSIDSMVQIGPYGRGDLFYKGLGEEDVFECLEVAKEIFDIDTDRIYLTGFSMGGTGAFEIGLKYPDIWAGCVPVCGKLSNRSYIENGNNLPLWINTGSQDMVIDPRSSRDAYKAALSLGFKHWKFNEYEKMGHSFYINWNEVESWLLSKKKMKNPEKIVYICDKPRSVYWVDIKKFKDENEFAIFETKIKDQIINITTKNITDYNLNMIYCPVDQTKATVIIENGKQIFAGQIVGDLFIRSSDI